MTTSTMERPNLENIIKEPDVYEKAGRKYCKWSRIAYYLNNHAKGWNFQLKLNSGSPTNPSIFDAVWKAPDGSGYLMCYFTDPQGGETGLFPYAIMDNRNNPVKVDRISARDVSDSHRRALAACAAFTFSLGYELWAFNEVASATETDKPYKRDRAAAPKQNIAVLAKNAILKEKDYEKLLSHEMNLEVRYTQGKITQDEYTELSDLVKTQKETLKNIPV
nr:rad52 recombinase [uncultured Mediterranean phage uvMED]